MNKNEDLPIVIRVLGSLAGLLGGSIIGVILVILAIIVTDSTFGLNNYMARCIDRRDCRGNLGPLLS